MLFDFFFPKSCVNCKRWGRYLCDTCFAFLSFPSNQTCIVCLKPSSTEMTHPLCRKATPLNGVYVSLEKKKQLHSLLRVYTKPPYLKEIEKVLFPLIYESLLHSESILPLLSTHCLFVPVPSSSEERRKGGYTLSEELSLYLAKQFQQKVSFLVGKREEEFIVSSKMKGGYKIPLILIDEQFGISLTEAAQVLEEKGYRHIWGIVVTTGRKLSPH